MHVKDKLKSDLTDVVKFSLLLIYAMVMMVLIIAYVIPKRIINAYYYRKNFGWIRSDSVGRLRGTKE